jgi:hypothetical protein
MYLNSYTKEQLTDRTSLARIIQNFIEEANVEDYEYDHDHESDCCDECYDSEEESCCESECNCHDFPGFDQNLTNILVNFIFKNYVSKEESK